MCYYPYHNVVGAATTEEKIFYCRPPMLVLADLAGEIIPEQEHEEDGYRL